MLSNICPNEKVQVSNFLVAGMLKAANISLEQNKRSIIIFGLVNCVAYIILVLSFKYLSLLHIWGLRMANYVTLTFISIWQVRHWIKVSGGYVPFLQAFFTALFTGSFSFILFGAFIFFYSFSDPYLAALYITDPETQTRLIPPIVLVLEGTGASIIVALIVMLYASRFEEGEAMP
jgi:hypothetical protein